MVSEAIPSTSPREALLACPPSPSWNPPSSFALSHQGAPLAHLFHLAIWCSGQTALAYLPTAHFMALRPLFPFRQAQYAQVFLLKPAPFCKLFAGLSSTNMCASSLLLFDSSSVLATLSSPSFLLPRSLWQKLSSLSSSIRLQWVPGHLLLLGNDAADELARQGTLLVPSAFPCSLSSFVSTLLGMEAFCHI